MRTPTTRIAPALLLAAAVPSAVLGAAISPVDLGSLDLGATIQGPLGAEVNSSFVDRDGAAIGDLVSSVSCPAGFATCAPASNAAGTVYTYVHVVTPGRDSPNDDPPFPNPPTSRPFNDVAAFQLGFEPLGFNGVAGYSFSDVAAVTGGSEMFGIELVDDASGRFIIWVAPGELWDTEETVTFFWQSTRAPIGPFGEYLVNDDFVEGVAFGPQPNPVPLPAALGLMLSALGLIAVRTRRIRSGQGPQTTRQ